MAAEFVPSKEYLAFLVEQEIAKNEVTELHWQSPQEAFPSDISPVVNHDPTHAFSLRRLIKDFFNPPTSSDYPY